ncbi:unnamed protein product [Cylindrotheca closterium]|uniref:THO complex subunit 7 homolog n=1 Tax=Cylindrotheca closterium TaxID=2856 RepID=A0AAD2JIJ1_9STRA|nr:unnamed protein product [Cylindrotheca closterium]
MTDTSNRKRKLESQEDDNGASFPPPFTTKTLEQRLRKGIMVQSGGQKGSLTRCVQKYALLTADASKESGNKDELLREFLQELQLYRMDLTRSVLLNRNLTKEIKENQAVEETLKEEIEETKTKVHECQQQAKRAKQVQSCFMEYETLSKLANTCLADSPEIQSTRQLKNEIARVKQEISSNQKEEAKLDSVLAVRKSQFHLLIQCMLDLKRSLDNDEVEDAEDDSGEDDNKGTEGGDGDEARPMEVDGNDDEDGALDDDNLYGDLG